MTTLKTLNIVGCGRVGKTLGALFHQQRVFQIGGVMNRTLNAARESIAFIGAGAPVIDLSSFAPADVWLLATSDRVLDEYAGLLASSGALRAGDTLFHCSGALPSAILKHPIISGAYYTASVHPVLTFAEPSIARKAFNGVFCGIEGDSETVALLTEAMERIGARVFSVHPEHKLAYHAAAVFSSNFLVALFDVAHRLHHVAGVPPELSSEILQQMMNSTLRNIEVLGATKALTGPVRRGDAELVRSQAECLDQIDGRIGETYRLLSAFALEIVERLEVLPHEEQKRVQRSLRRKQ